MTGPLSGLTVVDATWGMPGAVTTMVLADYGATVVKVERPGGGPDRDNPARAAWERGKRSVALDLDAPGDVETLRALIARADVFLESFRPGVAAERGFGYDELHAAHPRLVYCSISGYGQDGPYRDKVGHDVNYLGYGGVLNFIGEQDEPPVIPGVQIADIGGGSLMATIGILTALLARDATGRGQSIDIGMLDGVVAWNVEEERQGEGCLRPAVDTARSASLRIQVHHRWSHLPIPVRQHESIRRLRFARDAEYGRLPPVAPAIR
jgi:crotonobetainyl-CoA:carnitine CoA-transferase CaiB-like acyl-CoA transferase